MSDDLWLLSLPPKLTPSLPPFDFSRKPLLHILEPCTHAVQLEGLCALCGKDLTTYVRRREGGVQVQSAEADFFGSLVFALPLSRPQFRLFRTLSGFKSIDTNESRHYFGAGLVGGSSISLSTRHLLPVPSRPSLVVSLLVLLLYRTPQADFLLLSPTTVRVDVLCYLD